MRNNKLFSGQIIYTDPDIRAKTRKAKTVDTKKVGPGWGRVVKFGLDARKGFWLADRMPTVGVGMAMSKSTL